MLASSAEDAGPGPVLGLVASVSVAFEGIGLREG
jgi:hypothetical protein